MSTLAAQIMELVNVLANTSIDLPKYDMAKQELDSLREDWVSAGMNPMDFDEHVDLCFDECCSIAC